MAKGTVLKESVVACLDIGATHVVCLIALITENGFDVVGVGNAESTGVRGGVVVNIEATTQSIKKAREEAELMAGFEIERVWLGVAGNHIESFDSRGMIAVRHHEVVSDDIQRVIDAAKAVAVPSDREVIHVLPREFKVDDQEGICDPIGMSGVRLEASVHIVTGNHSALQNLVKCTEKAGLKNQGFVHLALASSLSVLSEDEKNLGVAIVDMGGGSCDLVLYSQGSVSHIGSVPVGGQHVTHDVAVGLRTPQTNAEELKKKHGCALASMIDPEESVEVDGVGGRESRQVLRQTLCEVIEPRAEETLTLIQNEINQSGLTDRLGSGVVFTGGASQLNGLIEMGEFLFDVPVRRGTPKEVQGLGDIVKNPMYAAAMGLLLYGMGKEKRAFGPSIGKSGWMETWTRKIRELLGGSL